MARMKDIKTKCENKFNIFKEKFRIDKSGDHLLKLPYDTTQTSNNISVTKDFCSEMKRVGGFGLVTYSITDDDKKKNKKSLNYLAGLFSDTSSKFSEIDPKRGPLNYSALAFVELLEFTNSFRKNLESSVMEPLDNLEKSCIEIQDLEKKLHQLKRDIASQEEKLQRADEQTTYDELKIQALKEQIVISHGELDNLTDLYIQKVLTFEATNFRHAEALHDMILLRTEYHNKCAKALMKIVPECNTYMEEKRIPLSFGTPLENHLRETKRFIAYPIEYCVEALTKDNNLQQEGLFRVSGSMNKANLLCTVLNLMKWHEVEVEWPPHVVADALKRYLREMPVSLLGKIPYSEWEYCYETSKNGNKQVAYKKIKEILTKLPKSYYQNLEYLIRFLNLVVKEKMHNLMGIQNICTVFVPNLFKSALGDSLTISGLNMENNMYFNFILESLLQDTNFFFSHSDQMDKEKKRKLCSISSDSNNNENIFENSNFESGKMFHRSSSVVDRYTRITNCNNQESNLSISEHRRQQLQVNPLNLEELEKSINSYSTNESESKNPPVPPRFRGRKE